MSTQYDLLVIGAGPGGYVCAIRAAQNGLRVACVDKRETLGGTCLNVGCIPSKALLHASERYAEARNDLKKLGIVADNVTLDLPAMLAHKTKTVDATVKGVDYLFRKNKIDRLTGTASFQPDGTVQIDGRPVSARTSVIATGSTSASLPGIEIDEHTIVSSTGALSFQNVPKRLAVIGGGVIGIELGSVWHRLGADVTIIEYANRLTPELDSGLSQHLQRSLKKQGMTLRLGHKVLGAQKHDAGVTLTAEPVAGGDLLTIDADAVLVSIGRRPATAGLNLEAAGIALNARGQVEIDNHFKTSRDTIYAIGDVVRGPMLAHKAEDEGIALADHLAGKATHINYDAIPSVLYTMPEIASVGASEDHLKAEGIAYKTGQFPLTANARARAMLATEGFMKVLACARTDKVLGVHIIAPGAGDMIAEATMAIEFGASAEDIASICHAHPTLSEALREAALAVDGRALHI